MATVDVELTAWPEPAQTDALDLPIPNRDLTQHRWELSQPVGAGIVAVVRAGMAIPAGMANPVDTGAATLLFRALSVVASVTLRGTPGENVEFFKFGFIQLETKEVFRAHYQGLTHTDARGIVRGDGSCFWAADQPPARPHQLCLDVPAAEQTFSRVGKPINLSALNYNQIEKRRTTDANGNNITVLESFPGFLPRGTTIPDSGLLKLAIVYRDVSTATFDLIKVNTWMNKLNFLFSTQSKYEFHTMFAVQKGVNSQIEITKSFNWSVWNQTHFQTLVFPDFVLPIQVMPGAIVEGDTNGMSISPAISGSTFANAAVSGGLPICNTVVLRAFENAVVQQSREMVNWDSQFVHL